MGYQPILLMDANGDYMKGKDKDLKQFLDDAHFDVCRQIWAHTNLFTWTITN